MTGYDGTYAIDWRCAGRAEIGVGDYLPCDPDNNPIIDAVSMTVVAVPQPSGGLPYRVTIGAFATTAMHENDGPTFSSLAETFGGRYLRGGGIAPCRISVMHTEIAWQTPDNRFVDRWVADAVRR